MKPVFGPLRPAFLILTPACVALGVAVAYRSGNVIDSFQVALILLAAVAAHAAVNALNEYSDFKSGLDAETRRTPFSGGSGTLIQHPELAGLTLAMGLAGLALTLGVGLYFGVARGWALVPVWAAGLLLVAAYTPWLTRSPWLCLVAPGLGFGPCMVLGTEAALTGAYSWAGLAVSLTPFFLVNNLLLLNQFPDVDADRAFGRSNLPILVGRTRSAQVYSAFFGLAGLALLGAVGLGDLPPLSLLGLAGLAAGVPVVWGLSRQAEQPEALLPYLGLNVAASIATPALMAVGAFIG
jgi:1,4-dihydroxy-2-naphthoate octaprenyltransferase